MGYLTGSQVDGVGVFPLRQIRDERGGVFHMLRNDSPQFRQFGEVYFSLTYPGMVKAWKRHRVMTQNVAVPMGLLRLAIYDDRADSPTSGALQVIETGEDSYTLIQIPPMVWYGFSALGDKPALIGNCTTHPHDPCEVERRPADDATIPYAWQ